MQPGFYCVVQFQPDRFRREGVNVGVLVVAERDRAIRLRFAATNERARRMFPGLPIDDQRLAAATRALERRLLEVERTEEGIRGFLKKESSQLVIFPPMRASIEDIDATLERLFKQLVEDPRPSPRVTCPRCAFSFDPASSAVRPEIPPAQVLNKLPLRPLRLGVESFVQPPLGAQAVPGLERRAQDPIGMLRSAHSFLALPGEMAAVSNVLPSKEHWS